MQARDIVVNAKHEYLKINQDEQFKAAYNKVEELRTEEFDPDEELTNYVMNKLLEQARKEGGNMFMGDNSVMNEYIFEFYTDYDALKSTAKVFDDNWSKWIRGLNNTPAENKVDINKIKTEAFKEAKKQLDAERGKIDVDSIRKQAVAEYKAEEKAKKEEAKAKAEAEKKAKEEAKLKALEEAKKEETDSLGGMFDLL